MPDEIKTLTYPIKGIDPEFWHKVTVKAAVDGTTIKAVILGLLKLWLEDGRGE